MDKAVKINRKNFRDLTALKFSNLLVLGISSERGNRNQLKWECVCDCGSIVHVITSHLNERRVRSCGCYSLIRKTKHGCSGKKKITSGYSCWDNMKQRCYNKNDDSYADYGGRGIKVCDRWLNDFSNFILDMGKRPSIRHSIERIDVNGMYETDNCFWGSDFDQSRNKRTTVYLEHGGRTMVQKDWCDLINIPATFLKAALKLFTFKDIVEHWEKYGTLKILKKEKGIKAVVKYNNVYYLNNRDKFLERSRIQRMKARTTLL